METSSERCHFLGSAEVPLCKALNPGPLLERINKVCLLLPKFANIVSFSYFYIF